MIKNITAVDDVRHRLTYAIKHLLMAALAFVIMPNIPYYLWLSGFARTRAVINIDFMVLGVVSIFISKRITVILYVILSFIDFIVFLSYFYNFTPVELVHSLYFAKYNPISANFGTVSRIFLTSVSVAIGCFFSTKSIGKHNYLLPLVLGVLLTTTVLADVYNGTNTNTVLSRMPLYGRVQHIPFNIANSGLLALDVKSFFNNDKPQMIHVKSATEMALKYQNIGTSGAGSDYNLALIIVESWGYFDSNKRLNEALFSPLFSRAVAARYQIHYGVVPFKGSTTNGELRELCGVYGRYRDIFNVPNLKCLPKEFLSRGYGTTGLHGFHGDMFGREDWWPLIGIRRSWFLEQFDQRGQHARCGTAFPGICDKDLVDAMGDLLRQRRQFVYGLTLNSHLPLPPSGASDGDLDCRRLPSVLVNEKCGLAQRWTKVFSAVARSASRKDIRDTVFVVVGDHSPPLQKDGSNDFSDKVVPYVILVPRQAPQ